jgi:hypothetical protein
VPHQSLTLRAYSVPCRFPWLMRTDIPPMLRYPVHQNAYQFTSALISMFYSQSIAGSVRGLLSLLSCFLPKRGPQQKRE